MNEAEANKQIDQMVMFIKQEAEEKANEITMSAEEEFNLEKLNLLESEKARIKKEYERKEAQVDANKKIESSKQLNIQRLKVLDAKQSMIKEVFASAKAELKKLAKGAGYTDLMAELLCQAMYKLQEPSQVIQVREADLSAIKAAIPKAEAMYKDQYGATAPQLTMDQKHFLSPAAKTQEEEDDPDAATCLGGVVVTSTDGRIVVNNTLDTRLRIVEEQQLPAIREMLFGNE